MSSEHVERRLAAILVADVAGSCRLIGMDEEGTLAQLKALRKTLFEPKITDHRGRIVKNTGDGALVEFASVVDAVRCADEIQRGVAKKNTDVPQDRRIELRIGIHVGDIIIEDNDIFGDGVNIAVRLESIAEPGGICISDDTYRQIRGKVDIAFEDMGPQKLKNIVDPMRAWRRITASASPTASIKPPAEPIQALARPDQPSVANLPFTNLSSGPDQDYFADGMLDEITTALSRFEAARLARRAVVSAAIDWKQFSGQTITLMGAIHPWSNAITPLLPQFTKLTGIDVVTDFQLETAFLGALPIKLAGGSRTPDVFMFLTYGQGISEGWLEPLNAHYSDRSLTDLGWYDESDLLKTARAFPVWSDGERYAFPITSEAVTLFINSDALGAKNLPVPETFDELLATAKAVKTNEMSGVAMRAQASGNSSPAAMSFVFSYGGAMVKDNKAAFASPEAIAAVAMYGQMLIQAGPVGIGGYEWYDVLNGFVQGRTAMAIDSSGLVTDISNPARSRVARRAAFAAFPHADGRAPAPFMSHWQACINAKSRNKRAAFLFLLWATSKPTSLQTAAAGLATTRVSAWSSEGFKKAFGAQAAEAALTNLQNADVDRAKAILFHPQSRPIQDAFMIGVNELVSSTKSAKSAMTAAAEKANAAIRG